MEYVIACECGREIAVRASDAGSPKTCDCGIQLQVPSLSVLRETPSLGESSSSSESASPRGDLADQRSRGGSSGVVLIIVTIVIAMLAAQQSRGLLMPIGLLAIVVGRIWFSMQILREMAPANALLVLFVPLMPTIFFFQRFDITWKPFVYGILGILICLLGVPPQ